MLNGCLDALNKQGIDKQQIKIFEVPGAFEIPFTINKLLRSRADFDIIIPEPFSKLKKQHRGYNQCQLITEGVKHIINGPIYFNYLIRNNNINY